MQGGGSALITDDMIRQAAEEYEQVVLDSLPDSDQWNHEFTPWFERKMKKLCRRQKHPGVYLALRRVACIVLVLLLGFCMFLAFNGEARAAIIDWAKKRYEVFTQYAFLGEPEDPKSNVYDLALVPEGYTLWMQEHTEEGGLVVYRNDNGQLLSLIYMFNIGGGAIFLDHEDCILKTATVGNWPADLYVSSKAGVGSKIVWIDEDNQVMFALSAKVEEAMLLEMAEKVFVKK